MGEERGDVTALPAAAGSGGQEQAAPRAPRPLAALVSCCFNVLLRCTSKAETGRALRLVSLPCPSLPSLSLSFFKHKANLSWEKKMQKGGKSRHSAACSPPRPAAPRPRSHAVAGRRAGERRGRGHPGRRSPPALPAAPRSHLEGRDPLYNTAPLLQLSRVSCAPRSRLPLPFAAVQGRGSGVRPGPARHALPAPQAAGTAASRRAARLPEASFPDEC